MTRSSGGELMQYNPKIKRTFHRQKNTIERGENSGDTDIEEQLAIFETTMEIMRAIEKSMMEYSLSTANGMIFSIAKPTVEANNFKIKPAIIEKFRTSVQFLLDRESLYDAWECFKSGTIMKKLSLEAFNIIDEIATNLYSYGQERTDKRTVNIHNIDAISTLSAQVVSLTHTVNNSLQMGVVIWNGAPIRPFGAYGQMGARTNLMSYSILEKFGLHELTPTIITLQLADRGIKNPRGIVEDVLVKTYEHLYKKEHDIFTIDSINTTRTDNVHLVKFDDPKEDCTKNSNGDNLQDMKKTHKEVPSSVSSTQHNHEAIFSNHRRSPLLLATPVSPSFIVTATPAPPSAFVVANSAAYNTCAIELLHCCSWTRLDHPALDSFAKI
ncbi:UNVERIFIED_CONTAM: hypothetical protein Scaly_2957700 [Sesamum calycinum]|uniref:Uncharacterized protein n=1 Tax=Sesamum calycinum TaxID=2727403 RepID=A0AAW2KNV6_9LAMI